MKRTPMKAIDALKEAHKIAFAPFVFQATMALKNFGILEYLFQQKDGSTIQNIHEELSVSIYGLSVLLEIAESSQIVFKDEDERYHLTKVGYFLAFNKTAEVNMNFTNDVCYQGLFNLQETIETGKPEGLKVFGEWDTIYEGLSQLEPHVQKSWFEFDHHYSDGIFEEALKIIFDKNPKTIFDIGGNTGKFAVKCCAFNEDVNVKIYDLPGQLKKALKNTKEAGFGNRVSGEEIDWLSANPKLSSSADTIWLSQFLDCFSKEEILNILKACVAVMDENTEVIIIETFTDRQAYDVSKFILEATSLYFTALANGNSKMYTAIEFESLTSQAGLKIVDDIALGDYHTMLRCRKA